MAAINDKDVDSRFNFTCTSSSGSYFESSSEEEDNEESPDDKKEDNYLGQQLTMNNFFKVKDP